jgi:hypothetical protein
MLSPCSYLVTILPWVSKAQRRLATAVPSLREVPVRLRLLILHVDGSLQR